MDPRISVIIPVYNVERFLREAMDSVVTQTLDDLEILCVNDGSKDGSRAILAEYEERDPRIRILDQENAGYGAAVNHGLDEATGTYVAVVEPDDLIPETMFEQLYEKAEETGVEVVKSDYYMMSGDGEDRSFQYMQIAPCKKIYEKVLTEQDRRAMFYLHPTTWTGLYRRSFLEAHHIRHNESPGAAFQDNGFWFQIFMHVKSAYVLHVPLYRYRVDNSGSSIHSGTGSFRIFSEYDFVKEQLLKEPEMAKELMGLYSFFRFDNYLARFDQTAPEHRLEFAQRVSAEYRQAMKAGEIDESLFTEIFKTYLYPMVEDPVAVAAAEQSPKFTEVVWAEVEKRPDAEVGPEESFLPAEAFAV